MTAAVRSRVRRNRHTLRVRRRIRRVYQCCRSRIHNCDVHNDAVRTTRVAHANLRREVTQRRRRARNRTRARIQQKTRRKRTTYNRIAQVRMAAAVRGCVRRNRRAFRVRRRIARVCQSRRGRVVHCDVNLLGIIATRIQHLDHRIEVAYRCRRTGDDTGQSIQSQARRQCIGKN